MANYQLFTKTSDYLLTWKKCYFCAMNENYNSFHHHHHFSNFKEGIVIIAYFFTCSVFYDNYLVYIWCSISMSVSRQLLHKWSAEELILATGAKGVTRLKHQLKLRSAYSGVPVWCLTLPTLFLSLIHFNIIITILIYCCNFHFFMLKMKSLSLETTWNFFNGRLRQWWYFPLHITGKA